MTNHSGDHSHTSSLAAGSRWRHLKSGHTYEIVCEALIERDLEKSVVYRSPDTGACWVRPLDEFLDGRFQPESST